jgi:hypothetical protein
MSKKPKAGKLIRQEQANEIQTLKAALARANKKAENEISEFFLRQSQYLGWWLKDLEEEIEVTLETVPLLHWGQDNFVISEGKKIRTFPSGYPEGIDQWRRDALYLTCERLIQVRTLRMYRYHFDGIVDAAEGCFYDIGANQQDIRMISGDELCSTQCQVWCDSNLEKRNNLLRRLKKSALRKWPDKAKK